MGVATEITTSSPYDTIFNKGYIIKPGDNTIAVNKTYASSGVPNLYRISF